MTPSNWYPWWKKPVTPGDWDKLVEQRAIFASSAIQTHKLAIETKMPFWFIQQVARNKYTLLRKYERTKKRAELEKNKMYTNLLHAIGLTGDDENV